MDQSHVQPHLLQAEDLFRAIGFQHVYAHLGVAVLELLQRLRQAPVKARAHEAQTQMAARALGYIARFLCGLLTQSQQLARLAQQVFAGSGEPYALAAALESWACSSCSSCLMATDRGAER